MTATDLVTASPLDAEDLRTRVQKIIEEFLAGQGDVLDAVSTDCAPLVEYVAGLMRGGKRLRPAFCYWGWRGAGGEANAAEVVTAGSALLTFIGMSVRLPCSPPA